MTYVWGRSSFGAVTTYPLSAVWQPILFSTLWQLVNLALWQLLKYSAVCLFCIMSGLLFRRCDPFPTKSHLKIAKNGIFNYAIKVLIYCISYLVSSRKFWSRDKKGETVSCLVSSRDPPSRSRLVTFVSLPALSEPLKINFRAFFSGKGNVWIAFRSHTCQIWISDLVAVLPLWFLPRGLLFLLLLLLLFHQLQQFPPPQDDRSLNGHLRVIGILKVSSLIGVKCEKCTSLCLQVKSYKMNQWAGPRSVMATTRSWVLTRMQEFRNQILATPTQQRSKRRKTRQTMRRYLAYTAL